MMNNWLSEDSLLHVKAEMTQMGAIGLEAVSMLFQPKTAINGKAPKIALHINEVIRQVKQEEQILLTLRDTKKNGQWTIKMKMDDLEKTLAKIFIRIKNFHSLRIFATTDCRLRRKRVAEQILLALAQIDQSSSVQSADFFLTRLTKSLIAAASSLPLQSISVHCLFLPSSHPAALTVQTLEDAFKLIAFLSPSPLQLRFCYNRSCETEHSQWERRLFSLLAEKCPRLQKLKLAGHCDDWQQLQTGLNALTNLRSIEYLAFDAMSTSFHQFPDNWLQLAFQHNRNLTHLSVGFSALASLTKPSASLILRQLNSLNINLAFPPASSTPLFLMNRELCEWIVQEERNSGHSLLRPIMTTMLDSGRLSMRLDCSSLWSPSTAESLAKVVFMTADETKKRITVSFIHSVDVVQTAERLKNEYPLLEVDESCQRCIVIRRGTATCVFNN